MGTPSVTELRALAELRHRDPERVRADVTELLSRLPAHGPERATATWVLGLTIHELGRPAEAIGEFRRAVRLATAAHDRHGVAAARASLAMSLLATGDTAGAHRELTRARADTPDTARGLVEPLWAVLLQRTGRLSEALDVFDRVLPALRRDGDTSGMARLLLNRGTLLAYRDEIVRATDDLAEAERLAVGRGLWLLAAMAAHNLAFAAGRRGDLPTALADFDRARTAYGEVGDPPRQTAVLAADECELLLRAGLAYDARTGAERALAVLGTGDEVDTAHRMELQLLLAQALLAEGTAARAGVTATAAAMAFRRARRPVWAALADYVAVQAEVAVAEEQLAAPPALLGRTRRIAGVLDAHGWPTEALHVRTMLGRIALSLGDLPSARRELRQAAPSRRGGTVDARTTAWHATALYRLATGDRAGAKHALRRGLRLVENYRAGMPTTELRAGAGARASELARLGLRLALADGRPLEVLRWAERWRAGALRLPPVTPPADDALAAAMSELHAARTELRTATLDGRDPKPVQRRVSRLEGEVRARHMRTTGDVVVAESGLDVAAVREQLGPAVLVEYVAVEGRVAAVTVSADRARLHDLGPTGPVREEARYLLSAQRRRMITPVRGAPAPALSGPSAVEATAERLSGLLLAPLGIDDAGPLVVVPTGPLHGMPWPALPGLFGRPLIVAPSADLWQRRSRAHRPPAHTRVALIAGPDLPGARLEIHRLAQTYPDARVLDGPAATVQATLRALADADLVHIAAHGLFRSDSPLFSSLLLADGPMTVVDMEGLTSAPATVVLPACDAARADVRLGDELIGTTTALLSRGVRSVIAPVLPVPDELTAGLMVALHGHLRSGGTPSEALAAAALDSAGSAPERAVAGTFVCLGAGERAPSG